MQNPGGGDAFHETVKNLVLIGWSWAFSIVAAWWAASQWRGRARTRERLQEQSAPDEEIVLNLSFLHAEPLNFTFFVCTIAGGAVLQKLALVPLATVGLQLVGAPGWPWLTPQLVASLWNVADLVCAVSLVGLLPVAYFYCETDWNSALSGRLREALKSLGLLYGLMGALLFAVSRLLSRNVLSAGLFLGRFLDLPVYLLTFMASPLGAEVGFRRIRNAWIPLDLKQQLRGRNEAIEIEREHLRSRLEYLNRSPVEGSSFRKVSGTTVKLARSPTVLESPTLGDHEEPSERRARSLSEHRSGSRSREAVSRYARHVSLNGLLSPKGSQRFAVPRSPLSDSFEDRESIESQIEHLDFEEMVNINTMKVPFIAWNVMCVVLYGVLLFGFVVLLVHIVWSVLSSWDGLLFSPSGRWVTLGLSVLSALAQIYMIASSLVGFYTLPLLAPLRRRRTSFPHFILGMGLLCAFALSISEVCSDLGIFRVSGYAKRTTSVGRFYSVLFLARLIGRGRPRFGRDS